MTSERDLVDACYRNHFGAFTYKAFKALNLDNLWLRTGISMRSATRSSKW
jgi:hypothetical protein